VGAGLVFGDVVDGLQHGPSAQLPDLLSIVSVACVDMAIDGRQENKVLNSPILQRTRTGDEASRGSVSGRMGSDSTDGWSRRNFGSYGAHILVVQGRVGMTSVGVPYSVFEAGVSVVGFDCVCVLHVHLGMGRRVADMVVEWLLLLSCHKRDDEKGERGERRASTGRPARTRHGGSVVRL